MPVHAQIRAQLDLIKIRRTVLARAQIHAPLDKFWTHSHVNAHALIPALMDLIKIQPPAPVLARTHAHVETSRTLSRVIVRVQIHAQEVDRSRIQQTAVARAQIPVKVICDELEVGVSASADQVFAALHKNLLTQ